MTPGELLKFTGIHTESETRRLLAPEEVGSRLGAMEVSSFHKLTDAA